MLGFKMLTIPALLVGLVALPIPALAQVAAPPAVTKPKLGPEDTPALRAKKREAAKRLLTLLKPVWSDEEIGRIMYIGWYSAAAASCDELEIDQVKLAKALETFKPADEASLSPERIKFLNDNLLMDVGMATGWAMAGHYRDVPKFCAEGRQAKTQLAADKHLFEMDTPAPAPAPAPAPKP
ncbi:hypothetical protein [Novosphingobium sp. FKTRR1]|uniref:hypothetical protein n=1 Tax=Novosphingobium sp. FKTRR1 TaxID=2879118 RepID=UPI001CF06E5D|nr:hypothetical protein [Novosphingobium sp. FKTRR1]